MTPETKKRLVWILAAIVLVYVIQDGIHFMDESQMAIVTQFGDPIGAPITRSGLFFDLPLIQTENYFDKRVLEYTTQSTQVPTKDKRFITVSALALWRISDPLKFFQRVQNEAGARARLDEIVAGEVRNAVASYDLIELVRATNRDTQSVAVQSDEESPILEKLQKGRVGLASEVMTRAKARAADLGFDVLDVRFVRMNYVADVQKAVFQRMIAERQRVAAEYRSEGQGEAARISGERDRDLAQIRSEAYRTAEDRRGKADADATRIYAGAYGRDPDFYGFSKSLDTYEKSLDPNTLMILDGSGEFFRYLQRSK
jgi:membrane protease subunit HflC